MASAWANDWQGSNWLWRGTRLAIYARDGHACMYCLGASGDTLLSVDHVDPTLPGPSRRGDNSPGNLVTACLTCNRRKGARELAAWAAIIGIETGEGPGAIVARVKRQLATPLVRVRKAERKGEEARVA